MQTKTELHQLLRDFRDLTGAQLCSIVSKRGTRVDVGRPTTLSAGELVAGSPAAERVRKRKLTKTTLGYAITAEFESEEAANQASGPFEDLVGIIEEMVCNDLEPESVPYSKRSSE